MHEYAIALGARLRAVRNQQGLSLHGVEEKSDGRWKAVVVGSYERGDRAITVTKLAELADFYGVPITDLLPQSTPNSPSPTARLVIDLERLAELPAYQAGPLAKYAATIQSQRGGELAGRTLTIRAEDLRSLAIIYGMSSTDLAEQLVSWGVLPAGTNTSAD